MSVFTGAGVAIVTPFHEDFSINYEAFAELIEYQIANSTDAIIVMGTTGESATTTIEEHIDAIRFCVKTVNGRVPVVAGTGSNSTDTAIHLSVEAQECGADALLIVSPYYNKATQNGLYSHYKTIASSVKLPIILYNVPSRTGCNILPETVVRLCRDVENIVGVKEACGNISQIAKLFALADGKVDIYSGNDDQIVPILSMGGKGVISVLSNVAPRETHDICQLYFDGKVKESAALQLKAIPLVDALFCEVNPIPVKKGVELMGIAAGTLRMPLSEIEPAHEEILRRAMADFGCKIK
ncbi:4-hydroxy-tetrahydrodipicolinate synthase [bacterium 1XD8-76]|nr:4-hydroxy-tetrahydrodipicolinate synthase [bacterium 1XD8-76]